MNAPLLSVIVPVYNVRPYLQECVDSILGQTYKNLELILVDDGSNDGSESLCDDIAKADSRVVVVHQCNSGQAAARNAALDICKGEYLSFIDSDDAIAPSNQYETVIQQLSKIRGGGDFIQFPYQKEGRLFNHQANRIISDQEQMYDLWINGKKITNYLCDKIWRRSLFDGLRLTQGMIFEDRHIFVDLLNRCSSVILTSHGQYFYRTHPSQTTQRRRDIYFLKSMLTADLHILDVMPRRLNRLRRTVQARMFSTFIELDALVRNNDTARAVSGRIEWKSISSLRMLLLKVLGYKVYTTVLN